MQHDVHKLSLGLAGCHGSTTCGSMVNQMDARHKGVMATFTFTAVGTEYLERFTMVKSGEKRRQDRTKVSLRKAGCGKTIAWRDINRVPLPEEFRVVPVDVSTADISVGPSRTKKVTDEVADDIKLIQMSMEFGNGFDPNLQGRHLPPLQS